MKYILHIKIEKKTKLTLIQKLFFIIVPKTVTLRIEPKGGGHQYARAPINKYIETEKLKNVHIVYPWQVWLFKIIKLRGVPKQGPELILENGKLLIQSPQINNGSLKINYPRRRTK